MLLDWVYFSIFSYLRFFPVSLLMVAPSSVSVKPN